jgi:hypothetical protein
MRFMVMVRATKDAEAGVMPSTELIAEMGAFNAQLVEAGILEAGEGLQPSSKGARIKFKGDQRLVTDGPFAETKELISGFWIINVASREEAIAWMKRCPNPFPGQEAEIEIRQIFAPEDFAESDPTGELRAQEAELRAKVAEQQRG